MGISPVGSELWERLASVLAAGGVAVIISLAVGTLVVPVFTNLCFVSRESKEGVRGGRRDVVPMGGGFIILLGATITVLLYTGAEQIRAGYLAVFLIAFWGFGLLGFLDDLSKVRVSGLSDKVKVLLQFTVTLLFAVSFYVYGQRFVPGSDLGLVTLPFAGHVPLGAAGYIVFVMLFLFFISNAVNITDGFNGLAGGVGAVVAVAYTVVTFLIGAHELALAELMGHPLSHIGLRMFALSVMSAAVAGSCVAYIYFNFCRGSIYFGDTGSMALGAALAFLALFSRTEFLFLIIGGVFFTEAVSVGLQRLSVTLTNRLADDLLTAWKEPPRPFVIAPLHHHFEHLLFREQEESGRDAVALRAEVRRRLTLTAWWLSALMALIGIAAQYGLYLGSAGIYNWCGIVGILLGGALLLFGILTRFLFDCYYIGPDRAGGQVLWLYRGVPLRLGGRRLSHVYERTDIPLSSLSYLERRAGLLQLFLSRVDARTAFGLLHYQCATRTDGQQRREHLAGALRFWGKVPLSRFLVAERHEVLEHLAECHAEFGAFSQAIEALDTLDRAAGREALWPRIAELEQAGLAAAETAYSRLAAEPDDPAVRAAALAAQRDLLAIYRQRRARNARVHASLVEQRAADDPGRRQVAEQLAQLDAVIAVVEERCQRLAEAAPEASS